MVMRSKGNAASRAKIGGRREMVEVMEHGGPQDPKGPFAQTGGGSCFLTSHPEKALP